LAYPNSTGKGGGSRSMAISGFGIFSMGLRLIVQERRNLK